MINALIVAESKELISLLTSELEKLDIRWADISKREHLLSHLIMSNPDLLIMSEELVCSAWIKDLRTKYLSIPVILVVSDQEFGAYWDSFQQDPQTVLMSDFNLYDVGKIIETLMFRKMTH